MPDDLTPPAQRRFSLTSLLVVPLKQHLGCCVVAPAIIKTVGSVGIIGSVMAVSDRFHIYFTVLMAPVIVWLCLWLEDRFHDWQHRRGHFAPAQPLRPVPVPHVHHDHPHACGSCEPCPVDHGTPHRWQRFGVNLAIAYGVIAVIETFHHHLR